MEGMIAWLQSFRWVRTSDGYKAQHFLGFVQLACSLHPAPPKFWMTSG